MPSNFKDCYLQSSNLDDKYFTYKKCYMQKDVSFGDIDYSILERYSDDKEIFDAFLTDVLNTKLEERFVVKEINNVAENILWKDLDLNQQSAIRRALGGLAADYDDLDDYAININLDANNQPFGLTFVQSYNSDFNIPSTGKCIKDVKGKTVTNDELMAYESLCNIMKEAKIIKILEQKIPDPYNNGIDYIDLAYQYDFYMRDKMITTAGSTKEESSSSSTSSTDSSSSPSKSPSTIDDSSVAPESPSTIHDSSDDHTTDTNTPDKNIPTPPVESPVDHSSGDLLFY